MNVMHGYCDIKARVVRRGVTKGVRRGSGGAGTVWGTKVSRTNNSTKKHTSIRSTSNKVQQLCSYKMYRLCRLAEAQPFSTCRCVEVPAEARM